MVHSYRGRVIGERKLRSSNIKVESVVLKLLKIKLLGRDRTLIQIVKLYTMNTSCPYAIQQPQMLRARFKNMKKN